MSLGPSTTNPPATDRPAPTYAVSVMSAWLGLLWVIEIVEQLSGNALLWLGLSPRDPGELPQIYTAPLLHGSWAHLIANTVPFFLLGLLILVSSLWQWLVSTFVSVTISGLLVWLAAPPHSITIGISGLIFGWLVYVLTRGVFTRNLRQIAMAVVVFAVWGGVLWGVLPGAPGVSWQAHLGGALGGLLAAWLLHSTSERRRRLAL